MKDDLSYSKLKCEIRPLIILVLIVHNQLQIWYHADQKIIRYDTKTSDGSDSDPYMTILDFKTGIFPSVDMTLGKSCEKEA